MAFASEGSINRCYDPSADQFLSVDPDVQTTGQPYVFVNDNPLNAEDPLGLCTFTQCLKDIGHDAAKIGRAVGEGTLALATLVDGGSGSGMTAGVCVTAALGYGSGLMATAFVGVTGNGTHFESWTVGGGGSSPNASIGVALEFSNAQTPAELEKEFSYAGVSYTEDGGYAAVEIEVGVDAQGQKIYVYSMSVGIAAPTGIAISSGKSYTWTTTER